MAVPGRTFAGAGDPTEKADCGADSVRIAHIEKQRLAATWEPLRGHACAARVAGRVN